MSALKFILLCFVGLCLCDTYDNLSLLLEDGTPEETIEFIKNLIKFANDYSFSRLWLTEEKTCKEVDTVLQTMKKTMPTDLELLMSDLKKFLKPKLPPRDKKKQRCMDYLEEDIEDAILEGLDYFNKCADRSESIREQEKAEIQKQRGEFINSLKYSDDNLDKCLEHSNKNSENFRKQCVDDILNDNYIKIKAACDLFSNSTCMAYFKNTILTCTSEIFDKMNDKKRLLKAEFEKCVGYTNIKYDFNADENLGRSIRSILLKHMDEYSRLNHLYDDALVEAFVILYNSSKNKGKDLENNFRERLQPYYDTLNQTMEDNRSAKERNCSTTAIKQLNKLVVEGTTDSNACFQFTLGERGEGLPRLVRDIKEFNAILPEAGNVALLRCIGERPQKIFGSKTIETCADLAWKNLVWSFELFRIKVSKTMEKAVQMSPMLMPNGKTCGRMRENRLELDAEKILYDCTRCLFGVSGDYYAVTTPWSPTLDVVQHTDLNTVTPTLDAEDHTNPDTWYYITEVQATYYGNDYEYEEGGEGEDDYEEIAR